MKKIFCIIVVALICSVNLFGEEKQPLCDKYGRTLYYGEREISVHVDRYVWFKGQEKLDLNPENTCFYGIGAGFSDDGKKDAKAESLAQAQRDFKIKMKLLYLRTGLDIPNEEFLDEMVKKTSRGYRVIEEERKGKPSIVISYCVLELSRYQVLKYYPEIKYYIE